MKKEIIFAIIIGLVVGLVITFGMYRARQAITGSTTINTEASPTAPSTQSTQKEAFLVSEPLDESLIAQPEVRVSGQAFPEAAIVVLTDEGESVTTADSKGNFSLSVPLQPGANVITIRAMGEKRETLEVIRSVVVSTADLTASSSATPKATVVPKATATPKATAKPSITPKTTPK